MNPVPDPTYSVRARSTENSPVHQSTPRELQESPPLNLGASLGSIPSAITFSTTPPTAAVLKQSLQKTSSSSSQSGVPMTKMFETLDNNIGEGTSNTNEGENSREPAASNEGDGIEVREKWDEIEELDDLTWKNEGDGEEMNGNGPLESPEDDDGIDFGGYDDDMGMGEGEPLENNEGETSGGNLGNNPLHNPPNKPLAPLRNSRVRGDFNRNTNAGAGNRVSTNINTLRRIRTGEVSSGDNFKNGKGNNKSNDNIDTNNNLVSPTSVKLTGTNNTPLGNLTQNSSLSQPLNSSYPLDTKNSSQERGNHVGQQSLDDYARDSSVLSEYPESMVQGGEFGNLGAPEGLSTQYLMNQGFQSRHRVPDYKSSTQYLEKKGKNKDGKNKGKGKGKKGMKGGGAPRKGQKSKDNKGNLMIYGQGRWGMTWKPVLPDIGEDDAENFDPNYPNGRPRNGSLRNLMDRLEDGANNNNNNFNNANNNQDHPLHAGRPLENEGRGQDPSGPSNQYPLGGKGKGGKRTCDGNDVSPNVTTGNLLRGSANGYISLQMNYDPRVNSPEKRADLYEQLAFAGGPNNAHIFGKGEGKGVAPAKSISSVNEVDELWALLSRHRLMTERPIEAYIYSLERGAITSCSAGVILNNLCAANGGGNFRNRNYHMPQYQIQEVAVLCTGDFLLDMASLFCKLRWVTPQVDRKTINPETPGGRSLLQILNHVNSLLKCVLNYLSRWGVNGSWVWRQLVYAATDDWAFVPPKGEEFEGREKIDIRFKNSRWEFKGETSKGDDPQAIMNGPLMEWEKCHIGKDRNMIDKLGIARGNPQTRGESVWRDCFALGGKNWKGYYAHKKGKGMFKPQVPSMWMQSRSEPPIQHPWHINCPAGVQIGWVNVHLYPPRSSDGYPVEEQPLHCGMPKSQGPENDGEMRDGEENNTIGFENNNIGFGNNNIRFGGNDTNNPTTVGTPPPPPSHLMQGALANRTLGRGGSPYGTNLRPLPTATGFNNPPPAQTATENLFSVNANGEDLDNRILQQNRGLHRTIGTPIGGTAAARVVQGHQTVGNDFHTKEADQIAREQPNDPRKTSNGMEVEEEKSKGLNDNSVLSRSIDDDTGNDDENDPPPPPPPINTILSHPAGSSPPPPPPSSEGAGVPPNPLLLRGIAKNSVDHKSVDPTPRRLPPEAHEHEDNLLKPHFRKLMPPNTSTDPHGKFSGAVAYQHQFVSELALENHLYLRNFANLEVVESEEPLLLHPDSGWRFRGQQHFEPPNPDTGGRYASLRVRQEENLRLWGMVLTDKGPGVTASIPGAFDLHNRLQLSSGSSSPISVEGHKICPASDYIGSEGEWRVGYFKNNPLNSATQKPGEAVHNPRLLATLWERRSFVEIQLRILQKLAQMWCKLAWESHVGCPNRLSFLQHMEATRHLFMRGFFTSLYEYAPTYKDNEKVHCLDLLKNPERLVSVAGKIPALLKGKFPMSFNHLPSSKGDGLEGDWLGLYLSVANYLDIPVKGIIPYDLNLALYPGNVGLDPHAWTPEKWGVLPDPSNNNTLMLIQAVAEKLQGKFVEQENPLVGKERKLVRLADTSGEGIYPYVEGQFPRALEQIKHAPLSEAGYLSLYGPSVIERWENLNQQNLLRDKHLGAEFPPAERSLTSLREQLWIGGSSPCTKHIKLIQGDAFWDSPIHRSRSTSEGGTLNSGLPGEFLGERRLRERKERRASEIDNPPVPPSVGPPLQSFNLINMRNRPHLSLSTYEKMLGPVGYLMINTVGEGREVGLSNVPMVDNRNKNSSRLVWDRLPPLEVATAMSSAEFTDNPNLAPVNHVTLMASIPFEGEKGTEEFPLQSELYLGTGVVQALEGGTLPVYDLRLVDLWVENMCRMCFPLKALGTLLDHEKKRIEIITAPSGSYEQTLQARTREFSVESGEYYIPLRGEQLSSALTDGRFELPMAENGGEPSPWVSVWKEPPTSCEVIFAKYRQADSPSGRGELYTVAFYVKVFAPSGGMEQVPPEFNPPISEGESLLGQGEVRVLAQDLQFLTIFPIILRVEKSHPGGTVSVEDLKNHMVQGYVFTPTGERFEQRLLTRTWPHPANSLRLAHFSCEGHNQLVHTLATKGGFYEHPCLAPVIEGLAQNLRSPLHAPSAGTGTPTHAAVQIPAKPAAKCSAPPPPTVRNPHKSVLPNNCTGNLPPAYTNILIPPNNIFPTPPPPPQTAMQTQSLYVNPSGPSVDMLRPLPGRTPVIPPISGLIRPPLQVNPQEGEALDRLFKGKMGVKNTSGNDSKTSGRKSSGNNNEARDRESSGNNTKTGDTKSPGDNTARKNEDGERKPLGEAKEGATSTTGEKRQVDPEMYDRFLQFLEFEEKNKRRTREESRGGSDRDTKRRKEEGKSPADMLDDLIEGVIEDDDKFNTNYQKTNTPPVAQPPTPQPPASKPPTEEQKEAAKIIEKVLEEDDNRLDKASDSKGEGTPEEVQPPADGNTAQPPADGNTAQPPADGNTAQPPADGNTAQPPADSNTGTPPADDNTGKGNSSKGEEEESDSDSSDLSGDDSTERMGDPSGNQKGEEQHQGVEAMEEEEQEKGEGKGDEVPSTNPQDKGRSESMEIEVGIQAKFSYGGQ
jgi:hypothetical protein